MLRMIHIEWILTALLAGYLLLTYIWKAPVQ